MRVCACLVALCAAALGQSMRFEVADVHASAKTQHPGMRMSALAPDVYFVRQATMVELIAAAYGVDANKVIGGPNWLELDRFDVIAKAPAGSSQQAVRTMLQALLAGRFGLAVHPDSRPMAAFVLSAGNGKPKLKESDGVGPAGCQRQPGEGAEIRCHGLSMETFAQQLHAMAGDYLQSPVVDGTKLAGAWDFSLQWTPRGGLAAAGGDGITIFDAVEKQLGLKLEAKQTPAQVLVVDRVNRQPTANPPEAASLPRPPAPAFEVATIKPTDPQFGGVTVQTPPNGHVRIQGLTMSYLIQTIWFLTPEQIVGAPKWFDTQRWDITAKVATAAGGTPQTDMDSLIAMVRTLLEERFKLKTHFEERIAPAYTLTAVKPKLQRADVSERTGCKEGPGVDGKDPRVTNPARSRLATCRNITMAEFAEFLPNLANALNQLNGVIRSAVTDATGLEGRYDFTLNWSQPGAAPAGGTDPNGTITIEEAIASQLGLKLEMTRRPTQVLVIDHVEEKPVEN